MRRPRLRLRSVTFLIGLWALGLGAAFAAAQSPSYLQYGTGGTVQPPPSTAAITTGQTTTGETTTGATTSTDTTATPPTDTTTDTTGAPLGEETQVSQPLAAVEAAGGTLPFTGTQALVGVLLLGSALAAAGIGLRRLGRQRSE
jgi:cytoskeletal protein RodZ